MRSCTQTDWGRWPSASDFKDVYRPGAYSRGTRRSGDELR